VKTFLTKSENLKKVLGEEDFGLIMNKITSIQNPEYVSFIKIKHFLEDIENSIALSNMNQSSGVNLVMQRIESIGPNDVN